MNGQYERVHHYHVRKSGGTSLNAAFWALGGLNLASIGRAVRFEGRGFVFVRHDPRLISTGDYLFSNAHRPAYTLELPVRTFTVTILRDPVRRIISYYRYLLWAKAHPRAYLVEPYLDSLQRETEWLGDSFRDFLDRVPQAYLLHQLHMFSATYDVAEATGRIEACDAVCWTETYAADLQRLSAALCLPLEERNERAFAPQLNIAAADRERAREMLEPEYELVRAVRRSNRLRVAHGEERWRSSR
jgi:hypothetical protein